MPQRNPVYCGESRVLQPKVSSCTHCTLYIRTFTSTRQWGKYSM